MSFKQLLREALGISGGHFPELTSYLTNNQQFRKIALGIHEAIHSYPQFLKTGITGADSKTKRLTDSRASGKSPAPSRSRGHGQNSN